MAKSKKLNRRAPENKAHPASRMAPTLWVLRDAALAGDDLLGGGHSGADPLENFDRSQFVRAVNLLKACRLLLKEGHWEVAAASARQLFEALINAEHINTFDDRETAIKRYVKFGLLQTIDGQIRTAQYDRKTGRTVDAERLRRLERLRDTQFPEFRARNGKFAKHWNSKSARALAEASREQPLRTNQYLHLFAEWSEQVHAAPATLLRAFYPEQQIDAIIERDAREGAQIGAMCVVLFAELWKQLLTLPALDSRRTLIWTTKLLEEARSFGAGPPPGLRAE